MKKLYSGFDLCAPTTSVSMTINGPAPMHPRDVHERRDRSAGRAVPEGRGRWAEAAAADRRRCSRAAARRRAAAYKGELPAAPRRLGLGAARGVGRRARSSREVYERIRAETLQAVRGTVQADILKEDQAQNTCIFSTEFALRMMGDVQQYFIEQRVRNFYSRLDLRLPHRRGRREPDLPARLHARQRLHDRRVLPGARHEDRRLRAEPVVLLLQRHGPGVRGHRARGAAHLGARHARALRRRRRAARCSSTTSRPRAAACTRRRSPSTTSAPRCRRCTRCSTTATACTPTPTTRRSPRPTEESVRRAVAIQLIINRELGLNKIQNPWQGSFAIDVPDRPGRGGGVQGVRAALRARRRARRDGDDVPARQDPGGDRSTTRRASTTARCRSSASTPSSPERRQRRAPGRRS